MNDAPLHVVVPVHRNAATLRELATRVDHTLARAGRPYELVLVNDACPDGSAEVLAALADDDPRVRVLAHRENRGQVDAVLTGLDQARGSWAVVLDADLQDPPEAIPALLQAANPGTGAVFAARHGRYESRLRLLTGHAHRRALSRMLGLPAGAGGFVLLSPQAVDRVLALRPAVPHPAPALPALVAATGVVTAAVPVARARRGDGVRSAYDGRRRVRHAVRTLRWAWRQRANGVHNETQRSYFERTVKTTMVPRPSRYLDRHLDEIVRATLLSPGDRMLEVGCGMGRYTVLLADRGIAVEGLDLSPVLLDQLAAHPVGGRVPVHCADVLHPPQELRGAFDVVVALFALHHMHDPRAALRAMATLLRPGGRLALIEPNPFNPLYYAQIAVRRGMTWEGDGGIVHMRRRPLTRALQDAGLTDVYWERFGFFPPLLTDSTIGWLESPLESLAPLRPILPFQLFGGRLP